MRKRLMLLAAPLAVIAIAASVAAAAPSDGEQSGPKLAKLHAVRPIAASPAALNAQQVADVQAYLKRKQLQQYLDTLKLQAYLDAIAGADGRAGRQQSTPPATSGVGPASSARGAGGGSDFLGCVRQRESGGDYSIHNVGGSGAAGAYQMLPGTWNSIAASSGRPDLVGVDPAAAPPADQDAMAGALYAQQGSAPWGGGC